MRDCLFLAEPQWPHHGGQIGCSKEFSGPLSWLSVLIGFRAAEAGHLAGAEDCSVSPLRQEEEFCVVVATGHTTTKKSESSCMHGRTTALLA